MYFLRSVILSLTVMVVAAVNVAPVHAQKAVVPSTKKVTAKKAKTTTKKSTADKAATSQSKSRPKSKAKKKTASVCAGLVRTQCTTQKECGWITPKKKVSSNGRRLTAYCRKTSSGAKKSSATKKDSKKSAAAKKLTPTKKKTN